MTCIVCGCQTGQRNTTGYCKAHYNQRPVEDGDTRWTDAQTDALAELIADGWTFGGAARALNRTRNSCVGRFYRVIAAQFGWQAA